jgi:hypothetical protein
MGMVEYPPPKSQPLLQAKDYCIIIAEVMIKENVCYCEKTITQPYYIKI